MFAYNFPIQIHTLVHLIHLNMVKRMYHKQHYVCCIFEEHSIVIVIFEVSQIKQTWDISRRSCRKQFGHF